MNRGLSKKDHLGIVEPRGTGVNCRAWSVFTPSLCTRGGPDEKFTQLTTVWLTNKPSRTIWTGPDTGRQLLVAPTLLSQVFCLEMWRRGVHMNDHAHSRTCAADTQCCYSCSCLGEEEEEFFPLAHSQSPGWNITSRRVKFQRFTKCLHSKKRADNKHHNYGILFCWVFFAFFHLPLIFQLVLALQMRKASRCRFEKSSPSMKLPNFPSIF